MEGVLRLYTQGVTAPEMENENRKMKRVIGMIERIDVTWHREATKNGPKVFVVDKILVKEDGVTREDPTRISDVEPFGCVNQIDTVEEIANYYGVNDISEYEIVFLGRGTAIYRMVD